MKLTKTELQDIKSRLKQKEAKFIIVENIDGGEDQILLDFGIGDKGYPEFYSLGKIEVIDETN